MALSADGSRIAWITTDVATHTSVHIATVGDTKSEKSFSYNSLTPERIEFLDADRVLVVERNPQTKVASAEVFGPSGSQGKFGPATEVGLGNAAGVPALITWFKVGAAGKPITHTLAAWRRDNLKPIARKVLVENSEGRVPFAGTLYKPLYFIDGLATMVGQKEGAYDKAHDIRKPDVEARADVFSSKLIAEKEIPDVKAFAQFTLLRAKHVNESNFVRFTDDRTQLQLIDAADTTTTLSVPNPLKKYDPETLTYRPTSDGNLTVSMTVDPVNAEAVNEKRTDKDWLDIYHLDVKSRALTLLVRVDAARRATAWAQGGNRVVVLHKHKGFGRGGESADILDIGPEAKSAPSAAAK
jgi:hypothetical protein